MVAGDFDTSYPDFASTLYPLEETGGLRVMRNTEGIRNPLPLENLEYRRAARAEDAIRTGTIEIPHTKDIYELRAIHKELFQSLYPNWAGQIRPHGMSKMGGRAFADPSTFASYWAKVSDRAQSVDWSSVSRQEFVKNISAIYADMNEAHVFREGNGRAGKLFLERIAQESPFTLDYDKVPKEVWNQRSELSGPDMGYLNTHPDVLEPVFYAITEERPALDRSRSAPEAQAPDRQVAVEPPTKETPGRTAGPDARAATRASLQKKIEDGVQRRRLSAGDSLPGGDDNRGRPSGRGGR